MQNRGKRKGQKKKKKQTTHKHIVDVRVQFIAIWQREYTNDRALFRAGGQQGAVSIQGELFDGRVVRFDLIQQLQVERVVYRCGVMGEPPQHTHTHTHTHAEEKEKQS